MNEQVFRLRIPNAGDFTLTWDLIGNPGQVFRSHTVRVHAAE